MVGVSAVRCDLCKALHEAAADTYIRVDGAIYRGEGGGLVGPTGTADFCLACFRVEVERWTAPSGRTSSVKREAAAYEAKAQAFGWRVGPVGPGPVRLR